MQLSTDRLSGLPDDVVFHILSFLPTKNSVRTSILAKGWRFHWAHVPCFGFTYCTERTKITNNQVMTLHHLVNTFHIGFDTSNHDFESWIDTLFKRNVRDLVIGLNYQLTLPRRLFNCETLVYLRLFDCGSIPEDASFPALKKLELVNVGYDSYCFLHHLLSGCPVLEELTIDRMKVLLGDVFSHSLTRLVMDMNEFKLLCLRSPSLRYLRLCGRTCGCMIAQPMPSLIEADIDFIEEGEEWYSCSVIVSVQDFCNVKCLKLSTCRMDVDNILFFRSAVKFHNLTELILRTDWRFITSFLENANNLRVLKILRMVDHNTQCWMEPKQVPESLTSHLETVNLVDFGWSREHEFDMVKYILKNGKVLKEVEIISTQHSELDSNAKLEAIKRLSMFDISETCQLNFVSFV